MRVIAAGDTYLKFERNKRYLLELGEGIILFAEGSFDSGGSLDWTLEDLAECTRDFPMTLIGEKDERIYIVKRGIITPAQFADTISHTEQEYGEVDKLKDVSYEDGRRVLALSRVCAYAPQPYEGNGKADLLLIASAGIDWEDRLDEVLEVHERSLKPNALIMQCDHHQGNRFIYSLRDRRMVGDEVIGEQGDRYIVHNI